jgi:hypothetical protein
LKQTIILLFSILLISCGTRKVVIQEVKKDSLSQIVTKIVTKEDIKIETKNDVVIDEFIITPLDTCKDIVVNGITYKNAVLSYKKTKDNTIQVQDIKVFKIEDKEQIVKSTIIEKKKEIERKSNPMLNLLWLLIPLFAYAIYKFKLV